MTALAAAEAVMEAAGTQLRPSKVPSADKPMDPATEDSPAGPSDG